MERLIVLSPHRDDASFSLGLALGLWSRISVKLQVLNFFTQSSYAPYSSATTIQEVSRIREEEDTQAYAFIHHGIEVASLHLLDAPLRLSLPLSQITQESSTQKITSQEFSYLVQCIRQHCADNLVLAPLALGNHVDHLAVHRAAMAALPSQTLAFYEDLPYATWTTPLGLQTCVQSAENNMKTPLEPFILHKQNAVAKKRQIAGFYRSQITTEEAEKIAKHAESLNNGERIWTPANSPRWLAIRSLATKLPQTATPDQPR